MCVLDGGWLVGSAQKTNRLPISLTADAERQVRAGHPWVFDQSITRIKGEGKAGDLGMIFDRKKNKLMAIGLYDPDSPIRLRIIHRGGPKTIDRQFWQEKLETVIQTRREIISSEYLEKLPISGWRVIHGENDGFPGLVVDHYAGTLVIKVYSSVWIPWLDLLKDLFTVTFEDPTLVLRLSRQLQKHTDLPQGWKDGCVLHGSLEGEEVVFMEYGLKFKANPIKGHKTGFFLDHRNNRKRVGDLAKGKRVLDLFSYVGGFSVHALAGGAKEVVSIDISRQAQAQVVEHISLNGLEKSKHSTMVGDVFELLKGLKTKGERFDLIISDPPSFAKKADERVRALKAYSRLARLVIPLVSQGGIYLAASCSARVSAEEFFEVQEQELKKSGRHFAEIERHYHDFDHPIGFKEGAYLKAAYYRLKG
ncbi:MAG: class I SAM-dependent rRNA methyltransferase [Bacteroidota bacterium]